MILSIEPAFQACHFTLSSLPYSKKWEGNAYPADSSNYLRAIASTTGPRDGLIEVKFFYIENLVKTELFTAKASDNLIKTKLFEAKGSENLIKT